MRFVLGSALLIAAVSAEGTQKEKDAPLPLGLVEQTGIELLLLDVEVVDANGRPVRGLTQDDFEITVNWKPWELYSVDELCACDDQAPAAEEAPGGAAPPAPRLAAETRRFVLYFDFSQLQAGGRGRAVGEAKHFIEESLRPGDEASIVTYASLTGIVERTPFTSDRQRLLAGIDAAQNDPKQVDAWPTFLKERIRRCGEEPSECPIYAVDEYFYARRSIEAFRAFFETLEKPPGRKAVLYLDENTALQPGAYYDQGDQVGGDFTGTVQELASAATSARANIYPIVLGDEFAAPMSFAASLAGATGGRHNRSLADLRSTIDATARAGCCTYRIGLKPPPGKERGTFQVRVEAAGKKLPWVYAVRLDDEIDRWLKETRAVLRRPGGARDLPVSAALVPVRASGGRWTLSIQVALDADALTYLPVRGGRAVQWQVGALLHDRDSDATWEMLGVSSVQRKETAGRMGAVVHRRDIEGMRAGTYRLAAFVRDETTSLYGGAEAILTIPPPRADAIVGPVLLRAPRKLSVAALPAMKGKEAKRSSVSQPREDALPPPAAPFGSSEALEARTWLCAAKASEDRAQPVRFLSRSGVPLYRFEPAKLGATGDCLQLTDSISTTGLSPGHYEYHVRWAVPGRDEPEEAFASFEIATPLAEREAVAK
jgi:VWFA-related protein